MQRLARFSVFGFLLVLAIPIAFTSPCQARVVYTQTNQTITDGGSLTIDFNHDRTTDVTISESYDKSGCFYDAVGAYPSAGDSIASNKQSLEGYWATAFVAGEPIWRGSSFAPGLAFLIDDFGGPGPGCSPGYGNGYWGNNGPHYLGVAFVKNGGVHFAWALLDVTISNVGRTRSITTTLTGFAYQTIVGKQIAAGQT